MREGVEGPSRVGGRVRMNGMLLENRGENMTLKG